MAYENVRNRYVNDGAGVVPAPRLLVMLYDRLVLDLEQAQTALSAKDISMVNDKLVHAQSIILELHAALDTSAWEGAAGLGQLYLWLNNELMTANVKKEAKGIKTCLGFVVQLQQAWHQAYEQVHGSAGTAATAAPATAAPATAG